MSLMSPEYDRDRSWVQPGTEVAIISSGGWNTRLVAVRTIEKVGKRDIALTDWPHAKFRVSDLSEQGRRRYYGDRIIPVDSDRYRNLIVAKARQEARNEAHRAVEHWIANRDDLDRARAAADALMAYVAVGGDPANDEL